MSDESRIVAFCCENSGVKAAEAVADEAIHGAVEIVPLPCSGRVEIGLVLKALERGRPGVLILGCPKDACKYLRGSHRAEKRVQAVRRILRDAGVGEERVRLELLSPLDSHRVAEAVRALRAAVAKDMAVAKDTALGAGGPAGKNDEGGQP